MAALHEALKYLTRTSWDSVPTAPDELRIYINEISTQARLIIESVPEPPALDESAHHELNHTHAGGSSSHIKPSSARFGTADEPTLALQREWGKAIKIAGARDNPLSIPVYKLPGIDGNGHWFGRRSVHEGLPFDVWKSKLESEMMETLRMNQERVQEGKAPDQSVRGIGAERLVEEIVVYDDPDKDNAAKKVVVVLGRVFVFHVSAQFPRPTAPRDFATMIINWDDLHSHSPAESKHGKNRGRNWMMVSRPCQHPDVPSNHGYIRGEYESVEFIREIVVEGQDSGLSQNSSLNNGVDVAWDREADKYNPVEWIMVTRSDPGGNIPRWMVEKGTPRSICTDAVKFLDWACQGMRPPQRQTKHARKSTDKSESSQPTTIEGESEEDDSDTDFTEPEHEEHHGLIASFAYLINAGIERYAPPSVLDYMPYHLRHLSQNNPDGIGDDLDESHQTPRSIPQKEPTSGEKEAQDDDETRSQASTVSDTNTPEAKLDISPAGMIQRNKSGKLSSHEKQLAKLAQQKRSVEAQLELVRTDIQSLRLRPSEEEAKRDKAAALAAIDNPSAGHSNRSSASSVNRLGSEDRQSSSTSGHRHRAETPTRESAKMNKVASGLFHEESKLLRQLSKIEHQQLKEAAKVEAQQRKDAERQEKARSRSEAECLRTEVESLKKECEKLKGERRKWLDLIGSLQTENSRLRETI
ncbi:hypothetical protein ARAM_006387 [Aspergillus rambellii]|uniref:DUF3074 domain-containing protein n=1 Tax=Aspergillus rambellii TaxID=308745 RepID=A0A0F8XCF1_9EURO|nr:hypothetical protein ARAM_006387 [Aspergillus rambellii]